jgi:hypothetical protein
MRRRLPLTFALVAFSCCAAVANANGDGGSQASAPAPAPSGGGGHSGGGSARGGGHVPAPAPSGGGRAHAPAPSGSGHAAGGGSRGPAAKSSYGSGSKGSSVGSTAGAASYLGASGQTAAAPGGGGVASNGGGGGSGDGGYGCDHGGPCVDYRDGGVNGGDIYFTNFYFLPGFRPQPGQETYGNTVSYEEHLLTGRRPVGGGSGSGHGSVPYGALLLLDPGATAYGNPGHREQSDFPVLSRMTDLKARYAIVMRDGTAFASTEPPKWSGSRIVGMDRTGKLFSVKASTVDLAASRIPPRPAASP